MSISSTELWSEDNVQIVWDMFSVIFPHAARQGNAASIADISLGHEKEDEEKGIFA